MAEEIHFDECEQSCETQEEESLIGQPPRPWRDRVYEQGFRQYISEMLERMRQYELDAENNVRVQDLEQRMPPAEVDLPTNENLPEIDSEEMDGYEVSAVVMSDEIEPTEDQNEYMNDGTPIDVDETNEITQAPADCEDSSPI